MIAETKLSEIVSLWKEDKKQYVKRSTFAAYTLLIENHILPVFGEMTLVEEPNVQAFVFQKLEEGLSHKTIKDILIVLKMILRFGVKNQMTEYRQIDIKFPTERNKHTIDIASSIHYGAYTNPLHIQESRYLHLFERRNPDWRDLCFNLGRSGCRERNHPYPKDDPTNLYCRRRSKTHRSDSRYPQNKKLNPRDSHDKRSVENNPSHQESRQRLFLRFDQ